MKGCYLETIKDTLFEVLYYCLKAILPNVYIFQAHVFFIYLRNKPKKSAMIGPSHHGYRKYDQKLTYFVQYPMLQKTNSFRDT